MNRITTQARFALARQWVKDHDHNSDCSYWEDKSGVACSCGYRYARSVLSGEIFSLADIQDNPDWGDGWVFFGVHGESL